VVRQLDRGGADAARRADDEQRVAGLDAALPQEMERGRAAEEERGGFVESEVARFPDQLLLGRGAILGVGAEFGAGKPATSSPTLKRVAEGPTASTTPANSVPRTVLRGPVMPKARRPNGPKPAGISRLRARQSAVDTVEARIRTRTSSPFGTGFGTSVTVTTSGGPYFV
jgi:hypothetical protein